MASTKKKIAAVIAVLIIAASCVFGALSALAMPGAGTPANPYQPGNQAKTAGDVVFDELKRRAQAGQPVGWFEKINPTLTEDSVSGTCVYERAGWLSTTGDLLDLVVSADAHEGNGASFGKVVHWGDLNTTGFGGYVNYHIYARKSTTHERVSCYVGLGWWDIDQIGDENEDNGNIYRTGTANGYNYSTEGVMFHPSQVEYVVRGDEYEYATVDGETSHHGWAYIGSQGIVDIGQGPAQGLGITSVGDWSVYYATHGCGPNGNQLGDDAPKAAHDEYDRVTREMSRYVNDDSGFALIGKFSTSNTIDITAFNAAGGGGVGFDIQNFDAPFGWLSVDKQSSNPDATKGMPSDYYDFTNGDGTTFTVTVKSSEYMSPGTVVGKFTCKSKTGGLCVVASREGLPEYFDDAGNVTGTTTRLQLPVGTYTVTEYIDSTTGYLNKGKYSITHTSGEHDVSERAWSGSVDVVIRNDNFKNLDDDRRARYWTGTRYANDYTTLTVKNEPMARLDLTKTSDEPNHWSYKLATYSRAGAVYGVYKDASHGTAVKDAADPSQPDKLTTFYYKTDSSGTLIDGSGVKISKVEWTATDGSKTQKREQLTSKVTSNVMMLEAGTYYVYEETASEGYTLDRGRTASGASGASDFVNYKLTHHAGSGSTTSTVTGYGVSQATSPGVHKVVLEAGELTTVTSSEPPSESPIHIFKNDATFKSLAASGANSYCANFLHGGSDWRAQGDATLTNAYFLVSYYDGYYASIPTGAPTYSWRIRTGTKSRESGEAFIGVETVDGKSETHNMAGSSASLLNNAGTATVPLGTITITEIKPPQGYTMKNAALKDPYVYLSQVRRYNQSTVKAHFPDAYKKAFYTTTTVDAGIANVREYTVGGAVSAADLALDANIDNAGNIEIYDTVIRGDAHLQKTDWDEEQLRNGYDPGNPWRVTDGIHPVPDMDVQKPEGNGTLKGAVFEVVSTSVNPVISPTDGKSIVWPGSIADGSLSWSDKPSGLTPVTVDKRSCGVNCYITTDVKGYATTKAGASVNNYVTAWKKGVRNNTTAYSTTDGNTIAWTTPSTWVGALAYGSYKTQEVKETDYGYLLNPGYRGEVKTRVNKQDDLIKTRYTGDPATWYPPEYAERVWGWKWFIDKFFFD